MLLFRIEKIFAWLTFYHQDPKISALATIMIGVGLLSIKYNITDSDTKKIGTWICLIS